MNYKISVVIRTYNEEKHLGNVLENLKNQDYKNYEIIIVDSGSNDSTIEIAKKYDVNIVYIKKTDFNYSYASNLGVQKATGDIVCFLSGHSVPMKDNYLSKTNEIFQNSTVDGCYGEVIALPDGSLTEKAFNYLGYLKNKKKNKRIQLETKIHPGVLSCSNASIRRATLLKHPFKDELGSGGEDVELAYRIIQDGKFIARVPELLVMHSHGSGFIKFVKEYRNWQKMYEKVISYIEGS